jgi:tetratricopeptide (TPR) repeat protein
MEADVASLRFDPKSENLAIGLKNGGLRVWAFRDKDRQPKRFGAHFAGVNSVEFNQSGQRLITASNDRRAIIWNVEGGAPLITLYHANAVVDAGFAAGDRFVTLSEDGSLRIYDREGNVLATLEGPAGPRSMALDRSGSRALVVDQANTVQIWNLDSRSVEGSVRLSELSAVGFDGASGGIITVSPSGTLAIWSPDGSRLEAYGDVSSVEGGWAILNPTGTNVSAFNETRAIAFNSPPSKISEEEVQSVVRAGVTRDMTTRELQLYASPDTIARTRVTQRAPLKDTAPVTCLNPRSALSLPNLFDQCLTEVTHNPSDANAWYTFARARQIFNAGRSLADEAVDPVIVIAAAMGHGAALASLGDWFSSREPRSTQIAGRLYFRAILNDPESAQSYLDWLIHWGDLARGTARSSLPIFSQRAENGDPAAHFILAVLAERPGSEPADFENAFRHYALAEKLYRERGIEYTAAAVRRSALARILSPGRVDAILKAAAASPGADRSTVAPGRTVSSQTAWYPEILRFDLNNKADIAILAGQAITALKSNLGLTFELDILQAEILRGQAKAFAKDNPTRATVLQSAQSLFEAELNRNTGDATSFDRLDEIMAELSQMPRFGDCSGLIALRDNLFVRWLHRFPQIQQRRISRIDAEMRRGACLAAADQLDAARPILNGTRDHLRELDKGSALGPDVEVKLGMLKGALADALVRVGDRENAPLLYAEALVASAGTGGLAWTLGTPEGIDAYIDLQKKTIAALTDSPINSETARALGRFGVAFGVIGADPIWSRYPDKAEVLFDYAILILSKIVQTSPRNTDQLELSLWRAYDRIAQIRRDQNNRDGALKSNNEALILAKALADRRPQSVEWIVSLSTSQIRLGQVLAQTGDIRALTTYRDALVTVKMFAMRADSKSNDVVNAYGNIARMFQQVEQYALAGEAYGELSVIQPTDAGVWNNKCWNEAIAGLLQDALADCNKSLELRPDNSNALDSRGLIFLKMGEMDRSISDYTAALAIDPRKAYSLQGRGIAKQRKGDTDGANVDLSAANAINPQIGDQFIRLLRSQ